MSRQELSSRIRDLLQDDIAVIAGAICFGLILYLGLSTNEFDLMYGNLGPMLAYATIISHWILAIAFGLFVTTLIYKIRRNRKWKTSKASSGFLGGLMSAIIIGCPTCSIGIASYLGIGGLLINLPGFGLEIKLLGLALLLRATWTSLSNLYVCEKR